jgi:enterobactin synthetase component D
VTALRGLGVDATRDEIRRGSYGEPLFPAGVCGSITHDGAYVAAAAARTSDTQSLGIDSLAVVSAARAAHVASVVAHDRELQRVSEYAAHSPAAFSLVFSAKESLFKCLFPLVRRYFDFLDAEIMAIEHGTDIVFSLTPSLSARVETSARLRGRFLFAGGFVHTAVWLEPAQCRNVE